MIINGRFKPRFDNNIIIVFQHSHCCPYYTTIESNIYVGYTSYCINNTACNLWSHCSYVVYLSSSVDCVRIENFVNQIEGAVRCYGQLFIARNPNGMTTIYVWIIYKTVRPRLEIFNSNNLASIFILFMIMYIGIYSYLYIRSSLPIDRRRRDSTAVFGEIFHWVFLF